MTESKQDFDFQQLSNVFGILTKVEHEERKTQLEDKSKELEEIKKATACFLFLDKLQEILANVNDDKIKCGCDQCTDLIGGNYPDTDDNYRDEEWGPSTGLAHPTETKNCLLYEYFKGECAKFKCPIPDDEIDHPIRYPRSFNLSACLGKHHRSSLWDEKCLLRRWRYRVKQMPFADQVQTIYQMLFTMCSSIDPDFDQTFDDWFKVKQVSLC